MGRRRLLVIASVVAGCGLHVVGATPIDGGGADAGHDASLPDGHVVDGGGDEAFVDAGAPVRCPDDASAASCAACDGGLFILCPATRACVEQCRDACPTGPIACGRCDPLAGGAFTGATCSPDLSPAASCAPSGCACPTDDASSCPLDTMVCLAAQCATCGDLGTDDFVCKDGTGMKKCKNASDTKPGDRYLCK